MAIVGYGFSRNVNATGPDGKDTKITLVVMVHENGTEETLAVREDLIRFAGEGIIEEEVRRKCQHKNELLYFKVKRPVQIN